MIGIMIEAIYLAIALALLLAGLIHAQIRIDNLQDRVDKLERK